MKRPVIGITVHTRPRRAEALAFELGAESARAVYEAGGLPVVLPVLNGAVRELVDRVQGVVLTGGGRLPPGFRASQPAPTLEIINPPRYAFERALIVEAVAHGLPLLGICRGMQMINECLGGGLLLNITTDVPDAIVHYQRPPGWRATHAIAIEAGSRLEEVTGLAEALVNSLHRQAVASPGSGLRVTARAADGVVEAVEGPAHRFLLGVQFHPEKMLARDGRWSRLFREFVAAAQDQP